MYTRQLHRREECNVEFVTGRSNEGIRQSGSDAARLQNRYVLYPVVAPEFSNWRDEQRAWRDSAVLFDQSHHMDELIVEGPQATEFLAYHGINSFSNFNLNRAKHYVPVTPAGHVIGDHIIFREREDKYILVGRAPTSNWLMFSASWGKWNVRLRYDPRSPSRPEGERVLREHYRFQIQGPDAPKIFEKMNGGPIPEIKFFHVDWINIGSKRVQALRHGMSGAPGLEVWGPYKDKDYIHSTIMQAAKDAGVNLVQCGSRAYSTNTLESGWIPSPLPGIYTGDGMVADYREWLGADMYEAAGAIGGSFVSDNIEDYYVNPFELGLRLLHRLEERRLHRQGRPGEDERLCLQPQEGHLRVEQGGRAEGHRVGLRAGYALQVDRLPAAPTTPPPRPTWSCRATKWSACRCSTVTRSTSAACCRWAWVDQSVEVGDVLTMKWGEPETTGKTSTEEHQQTEIRVRVSPTPYAAEARENYADSWRTKQS
jgi:vanillate/3-O-methylgallate O-demethylase